MTTPFTISGGRRSTDRRSPRPCRMISRSLFWPTNRSPWPTFRAGMVSTFPAADSRSSPSLFVAHSPGRRSSRFFYVRRYTEIVHNSLYTARWIEKRWNLTPHKHIYPPVDMEPAAFPLKKENIILSVSRFDAGGNKPQLDMIRGFQDLVRSHPREMTGWKLVLVGGSPRPTPYLERIPAYLQQPRAPATEL